MESRGQSDQPDSERATTLPRDWERRPELAQALRVLVEGAVRLLRRG